MLGNEAAARFFGSTVQDMVGKTDYDLLLHHGPAADALVMAEQTTCNATDLRAIESQQRLSAQQEREGPCDAYPGGRPRDVGGP